MFMYMESTGAAFFQDLRRIKLRRSAPLSTVFSF